MFPRTVLTKLALAIQVVPADFLLALWGRRTGRTTEHRTTHLVVMRLSFKKQMVIDNLQKILLCFLAMTLGIGTVLVDFVLQFLGLGQLFQ